MARLNDALLGQNAFARNANQPMLDLQYGGMHGWSPDLSQWVSNGAYVRKNLVCIVLEYPRFFDLMPEPDKWKQCLKALMEVHTRTIEGLAAGLTVEFEEHPVGGAGEMHQEVTNVTRARSEPVHGFVEKYGMPIQTFLYQWIQYGMMDPETKYALVGTLPGEKPDDLLADWSTASCLYFEPDPLHRKVIKSWVTVNMMPKETGPIEGKRDLTAAGEISNLSIPFTGISSFNLGSNVFAQTILDALNMNNANPYLRPSFINEIAPDLAVDTAGYKKNIEDLAQSAIIR